jgi:hypothetical protein
LQIGDQFFGSEQSSHISSRESRSNAAALNHGAIIAK